MSPRSAPEDIPFLRKFARQEPAREASARDDLKYGPRLVADQSLLSQGADQPASERGIVLPYPSKLGLRQAWPAEGVRSPPAPTRLRAQDDAGFLALRKARGLQTDFDARNQRARLPLGPLGADGAPFWLDAWLGGGAPRGALYEIAPGQGGDQPLACGFALSFAIRFARAQSGPVIWVVEDFAAHEGGAVYGPGLSEWGLDPSRLILARAADAQKTLWALEEALKCSACAAVVGELWGTARNYSQSAARRLVLAARKSRVPCILFHPSRIGGAIDSHGAQARFAIFAYPHSTANLRLRDLPTPARPGFSVQVLRTRLEGDCAALPDPHARRPLVWKAEEGLFDDPLSLDLVAGSSDRAVAAQRA